MPRNIIRDFQRDQLATPMTVAERERIAECLRFAATYLSAGRTLLAAGMISGTYERLVEVGEAEAKTEVPHAA